MQGEIRRLYAVHRLSVTGLLLENTKSFRWMLGKSIEPVELLPSLLLPGVCIWLTFTVDISFFFRTGILFFYLLCPLFQLAEDELDI